MSYNRLLFAPAAVLLVAMFLATAVTPSFAQISMPDGVKFVDNSSTLRAGGAEYTITVQLKIHDADYPLGGIGVYFESSNLSVLDIGKGTYVLTDSKGRASLNITTGQNTGSATVSVVLMSTDGDVRAAKTYDVAGFSNISGTIYDMTGNGIPGATVTLYTLNNSTKGSPVQMAGNPAIAAGADSVAPGSYTISDVPYGSYYIEATVEGQSAGMSLTALEPSVNASIEITGYMLPTPTPTPTPTPEPVISPTPTPVPASPTPAPKASTGDSLKQLAWIAGAAIVLAVIIVAVQLSRQKKSKK